MKPDWIHIEYAAGNYGNAHVFGNFRGRSNYEILIQTLVEMVEVRGPRGVFFVNDLIDRWAQLAAITLQGVAAKKGWKELQIRVLAGDVSAVTLPLTHTAHLKNPRIGLILLDSTSPYVQKAAALSQTGLEITTHYPSILLSQAAKGGWTVEKLGPGERYRFPSGRKRRLPTIRYRVQNPTPHSDQQLFSPSNLSLGRLPEDYSAPAPSWMLFLADGWHALLVTLGIRRQ